MSIMAFTQNDLDEVKRAIASGELEVQYEDSKVRYRSMDELLKAKGTIEQELAHKKGRRRIRCVHMTTRGL